MLLLTNVTGANSTKSFFSKRENFHYSQEEKPWSRPSLPANKEVYFECFLVLTTSWREIREAIPFASSTPFPAGSNLASNPRLFLFLTFVCFISLAFSTTRTREEWAMILMTVFTKFFENLARASRHLFSNLLNRIIACRASLDNDGGNVTKRRRRREKRG